MHSVGVAAEHLPGEPLKILPGCLQTMLRAPARKPVHTNVKIPKQSQEEHILPMQSLRGRTAQQLRTLTLLIPAIRLMFTHRNYIYDTQEAVKKKKIAESSAPRKLFANGSV